MTQPKQISMDIGRFATISANILIGYFMKANKDVGKKRFKELEDGKTVSVGDLGTKSGDEKLTVKLALDTSEFRGHLTFHLFHQALDALLKQLGQRLNKKEDLRLFTNQDNASGIFLVPGLVEDKGVANMLVLGMEGGPNMVTIKLQFLDPAQFEKQQQAGQAEGE